jgi:nitrite reductase/ring-hydroxylating ferredoxin subunit
MADFTRAASVKDVPEGGGKVVLVGGKGIALFNVGGKFCAIDNTCPHRGGPLGEGSLQGELVTCPWHGWVFNVTTGTLAATDRAGVACYAVKVEGEDILVRV